MENKGNKGIKGIKENEGNRMEIMARIRVLQMLLLWSVRRGKDVIPMVM